MNYKQPSHRRQATAVKQALRGLNNQLSLFTHRVAGRVRLKDIDLDCLDLIGRHGPLGPSAIAGRAGLHPATVTGILDRLEQGGWITRERKPDATDRRAVTVEVLRNRNAELFGLFAGMNAAMDEVCANYTATELELIAGFLRRTTNAGHEATDALASH
ncbi:MarR family transcriptional regulator [Amycolatopsis cihanbeyliensis]|uniref:DNA-binding MarR family transcriptional regulator n=1 Tax=Amycolatopsis cihanbeyliensis TaxID=1128664 RepID=A0A542DHY3_AMYCI|nr:MarR family transcriptional regulator [Amycolatopsis cihanbeyliensis]TQJ02701.1 DNA-binding MarR family transcriptional regulator [Amycolatopsis cihanbeyliensis]